MKKYFIILPLLLLFIPSARAQDNPTIAVFDFDLGSNLDPKLKISLSRELTDTLVKTNKYRVLDRGKISATLPKNNPGPKIVTDNDNALQIAKTLAANKILTGRIEKIDTFCHLAVMITDTETGEIEKMETSRSACEENALTSGIKAMVSTITKVPIIYKSPEISPDKTRIK
ncbi:MAG: CsgG/HfaB family protein [bacterium]|nr:CsgG/HfaB family protein [bacterium]